MDNKHRAKVVDDAIRRLRKIANARAVADEKGRILYEGHPKPGEISDELNKVYRMARAKAKKEASRG